MVDMCAHRQMQAFVYVCAIFLIKTMSHNVYFVCSSKDDNL